MSEKVYSDWRSDWDTRTSSRQIEASQISNKFLELNRECMTRQMSTQMNIFGSSISQTIQVRSRPVRLMHELHFVIPVHSSTKIREMVPLAVSSLNESQRTALGEIAALQAVLGMEGCSVVRNFVCSSQEMICTKHMHPCMDQGGQFGMVISSTPVA